MMYLQHSDIIINLDGHTHHQARDVASDTAVPQPLTQRRGGPGRPPGGLRPREPISEREVKRPTLIRPASLEQQRSRPPRDVAQTAGVQGGNARSASGRSIVQHERHPCAARPAGGFFSFFPSAGFFNSAPSTVGAGRLRCFSDPVCSGAAS